MSDFVEISLLFPVCEHEPRVDPTFASTQDAEGCAINIKITDKGDGTYLCTYTPTKPIKHTIIIAWSGVNVPNSPFRVRRARRHSDTLGIGFRNSAKPPNRQ